MLKVAVTTSRDDDILIKQAKQLASDLEIEFLPRLKRSINYLRAEYQLDYLLVVERQQVILKGETMLAWHPSMAVPRIKAIREGKKDPLVEAMGAEPGYKILDCTLGLAADALVASYAIGPNGCVIGLEASKYLAFLTKWGLEHYSGENKNLFTAIERITVLNHNYNDYLPLQSNNSYDIVYFDPMFNFGLKKSSALNALRPLAVYENITGEVIKQALRVARRRVVMKQNSKSQKCSEMGANFVCGGRFSPVSYCVWEKT